MLNEVKATGKNFISNKLTDPGKRGEGGPIGYPNSADLHANSSYRNSAQRREEEVCPPWYRVRSAQADPLAVHQEKKHLDELDLEHA